MKKQNIFQIALLAVALFMGSAAMAQSKIYYVSPTGTGDGSSWANTMSLENALTTAKAGDQIWVQGFEEITTDKQLYIAPADGFTLKSGVQLYGGFKGDETTLDARETLGKPYQLKYRSVLSGDISGNDEIDNTNLIFPANTSRDDNATHVLSIDMTPTSSSGNNNTYPTVVNGFSIGGGQADEANEYGGGIYIHGNNTEGGIFRIERCFFVNNYATQGGAIYVTDEVKNVNNGKSLINQCAIYNNAAGERSSLEDEGGGLYLAGAVTVVNCAVFNNENGGFCLSADAKVVNCTVTRNTGGGIDMIDTPNDSQYNVFNTAIWGNSMIYSVTSPNFKHSAYSGATENDGNGNRALSNYNYENNQSPYFEAPSSRTGFDRDFKWNTTAYPVWTWDIQGDSYLVDKGSNQYYNSTTYGSYDMGGATRISGPDASNAIISIGAYEYQYLPASRIRYVMPTAQGTGDGSSWENASNNIQNMINELADNNPQHQTGEVWIAAGIYTPQSQVISGATYSASFRMRDGISLYGGFDATNPEESKQDRKKGTMPWMYTNRTILEGSLYTASNTNWNEADKKWAVNSDSRHVVFFAPLPSEGKTGFDKITTLNGVTIRGGYAQGDTGLDEFLTDRGAGVYMSINAYLDECVVTENSATGNGGGVYLNGGRVLNSLAYNNNSDSNGGGIYVDNAGIVLASMVANNSASNGAGVYLAHTGNWSDGQKHPEYLILSTSVISNNTSRQNGAIYCDRGGIVQQNTIVNNYCPTATDNATSNASQTGGIYINEYALVYNSVIWNNLITTNNVPMYAKSPTTEKVRFLYNGVSGTNNAVWNNTLQQEMIALSEENNSTTEGVIDPEFDTSGTANNITTGNIMTAVGVQQDWKLTADGSAEGIDFYWEPVTGSNLRARGMTLGGLPAEVLMAPELDITNELFAQKPSLGAFNVDGTQIKPQETNDALIIYVDADCTDPTHNGESWATAYRSLNEALAYFATLDADIVGTKHLEIHVLEGDLWPRYAYTNLDPKTATIDIPVMASGQAVEIYGGYRRDATDATNNTVLPRNPLTYRSILNANREGKIQADGLYHCITVAAGAKAVIDGFHVVNGYAAGEATRQYGAGLLVHDRAEVTLNNCIFENNTAVEGAAIDARNAKLTMNNCVVNNNTNITETSAVINCTNLTMNHVTVVNNIGAAPANMGTSSFSAGNSSNNTQTLASTGEAGAKNFANPTNAAGATLGFDTYLGGYSEFRPLTSSTEAAVLINKATGTLANNTKDITTINGRDLGGIPDLGAYEANLPESGRVIYVKKGGTGNGLSWENAMGDINDAVQKGLAYNNQLSEADKQEADKRAQVWVAAGTYAQDPKSGNPSCFVIEEGVDVFGGFPNEGTPGFDDRRPLVSTSIYTQDEDGNKMTKAEIEKYETILQPATTISTSDRGNSNVNRRVLSQRDKYNPRVFPEDGDPIKNITGYKFETHYYYNEPFRYPTTWDGFTVQNGFLNIGNAQDDGGAGVRIYENTTLKNCIVQNNENYYRTNRSWAGDARGGGVFCFGGTLINCYIQKNWLGHTENTTPTYEGSACYGGGVYMNYGTLYNCIIADNTINAAFADGAGILIEVGEFYNNTVINNTAKASTRGCGGLRVWVGQTMKEAGYSGTVKIFNSIIYGNTGFKQYGGQLTGNENIAMSNSRIEVRGTLVNQTKENSSNSNIYTDSPENWETRDGIYFDSNTCPQTIDWKSVFADDVTQGSERLNYRLGKNSIALNSGDDEIDVIRILPPKSNGNVYGKPAVLGLKAGENFTEENIHISLFDYTDMDFTDRIKDCTVDAGAYERSNQDNVNHDANGYYYVTQNGAGNACGDSPANAACAMKLQEVLNAAGEYAQNGNAPTVKVAGYEQGSNPFVYHVNTLSNPNDPQSYTYVVPEGIIVEGGYTEDFTTRNPKQYNTILSAIKEATTSTQEVNGYHVVTFKPASITSSPTGQDALTKTTIIDGLYLIDGSATSMAGTGNPKTRGGGAIVPSGAHVRNCVITRCEAIEGGGLYVMPGGMVSGCAIINNKAENGAGLYADNTDVDKTKRVHIVSCTVTDNTASSTGGGIYLEDGAAMVLNSVFWGNTAPSDKNVSGVLTETYADNLWKTVFTGYATDDNEEVFYPFNNCYVETYEMPTNFENVSMTSDESVYFASTDRTLKVYSPLIKHGVTTEYYETLQTNANVSTTDIQGINRVQSNAIRVDVGAYAFNGGVIPTDKLIKRIFVSKGTNVTLPDNTNIDDYIGRSFYTSVNWVDDALEYIREMRKQDAYKDTPFEILIASGTYKPSMRREDASTTEADQRQNSYVVPQGVSIYGGFSGTELISSTADGQTEINNIPNVTGDFKCNGKISDILATREYSDFNQNGINEPWELANQTILSGRINVSEKVKSVYHVVYSDAETATTVKPVVLDGLTIMEGETSNQLSNTDAKNEMGRGGGIYSNGVPYLINRCRLTNNLAVRGGAVYIRDAKLTIINSILAGNGTVDNPEGETSTEAVVARGGAVYISGMNTNTETALYAVNTLWVNNETAGYGGAIGTNYAEGVVTHYDPAISIMNNTFVRNKAKENAVIFHHNAKNSIVNTLMWGNESEKDDLNTDEENLSISYSASDKHDLRGTGKDENGKPTNILLSVDNMAVNGPRFTKPSTVAGVVGNDAYNLWNPASISVLTDAGNGINPILSSGDIEGAYKDWMEANAATYATQYMGYADYLTTYLRYAGPLDDKGKETDKKIDIGLYEYQYELAFPKMDAIYVATVESGKGDGTNWANATSDLRGALVAMANPTGSQVNPYEKNKAVYIKAGEYSLPRISAGTAFTVQMSESTKFGESLTVKGSYNESGVQDFSQPTIITTQESNADQTNILMAVAANKKTVTMEGLTFINKNTTQTGGIGMQASSDDGKLTLKQVAFRGNKNIGLQINSGTKGQFLLVNTLFADGGTGLDGADQRTTVVNATFANNTTDYTSTRTAAIYNSVSWNNDTQNLTTDDTNKNVALSNVNNDDVNNGPNFRDPDNTDIYSRDYRIRPSVKLLNKGSNDHYIDHALELTAEDAVIPTDEKALGNNARLVDNDIDVGAYEYEAPLQPIVYVKADLMGTADGKSWETALGDLQGAVDLAGLYANNNSTNAYVFVHGNYHDTDLLNLTLGNTKVYGGMNDERSSTTLGDSYTKDDVEAIVSDLLAKRKGMLETTNRSSLENVTITADGVIDGFEVTGTATVNAGTLSTSVVKKDVGGAAAGLLYNSLVLGDVSGVKAVNVTATGEINGTDDSGNNRASATGNNTYVTDEYWNYQLMETSTDIDAGTIKDLKTYTDLVGHERDLIGNARIRNIVDNGCFETWNISKGMTTDSDNDGNVDAYPITATDYPVGKSVVYVRKGQELKIQNADDGTLVYPNGNAFNPGFLLLEHQAGLRGNGNYISLTNFAVERNVPGNGSDLANIPFTVSKKEETDDVITYQIYNGKTRARYDYKFDSNDSKAWENLTNVTGKQALALNNSGTDEVKVRFYGNSYEENGKDKDVELTKWNFNDSWTTDNPGTGNRFTHKENMSWNLFGSPYLCAMNYDDMEYGRVIYGYNGSYQTVKTYNSDDGTTVKGHIPAGSAVFTQTATLKDAETFSVKQPAGSKSGIAFPTTTRLIVALNTTETTQYSDEASEQIDMLQLNAVESSEARTDFDMGADGVKWMAEDRPQIYAEQNGGRYSLLSAVDKEGSVQIGLSVPQTGMYSLYIPADCDAYDYETVVLEDKLTGTLTDLKAGAYTFNAPQAGDLNDRFQLYFNRSVDEAESNIRVVSTTAGQARVLGIRPGDVIRVYNTQGMLVEQRKADTTEVTFSLPRGIHLFKVTTADGDVVKKAAVR